MVIAMHFINLSRACRIRSKQVSGRVGIAKTREEDGGSGGGHPRRMRRRRGRLAAVIVAHAREPLRVSSGTRDR
jgi:hypothetical protein